MNLLAALLTLFSFDDHAIPYKSNLKLTLLPLEKHPSNPVLPRGPSGSPDAYRAQFYGSVLRINGKFRMWYIAGADNRALNPVDLSFHVAYAESDDGLSWTKPRLGLTGFRGSRENNLVEIKPQLDMSRLGPLVCFVLHEPEDPDPARRYKMLLYGRYYESTVIEEIERAPNTPSTIFPLFSADGLRWRLAIPPPKGPWFVTGEVPFPVKNNFELGGLYKFDGVYHAAGQEMWPDISMPDGGRVRRTMVTHWSGDFRRWSHDRSFSFQRSGYRSPEVSLEEAHEPAGVWNRGNVLVGTYGLWHGAREVRDRRMDLGLLVSNDGIHFREPIADFVLLKAGGDGAWDQRGLIHGQGYVNIGDRTYVYYGSWDLSGGNDGGTAVGLATMPRDRFGFLSTREPGDALLTTMPFSAKPGSAVLLNIGGVGPEAQLEVEVISKFGAVVQRFHPVRQTGLGVKAGLLPRAGACRLRMRFTGTAASQIKLYAAYIGMGDSSQSR